MNFHLKIAIHILKMLLYALLLLSAGLVYLGGPMIVYNQATSKYRKFRLLNNLVASQHTSIPKILWVSFTMVCKSLYISFLQYMNNSVKKLDRNTYELTYVINGTLYKALVVPRRGPSPVLQITDENSEDISDTLLPYFNHLYNYNPSTLTPRFFGCKSLTFEYSDGNEITFATDTDVTVPGSINKKMKFVFKNIR